MNLHRTTGRPDWADVKPGNYNQWQLVAARTRGIVTPANVITVIGFAMVMYGLICIAHHRYWLGIFWLVVGRLADIADGWLAEMTGTKSPLGELLDVTVDKLGMLLTIIVLYISRTAPWWALAALLAPQVIISMISAYHAYRKAPIHPSRIGKLSMLGSGVSLLGLILLRAINIPVGSLADIAVYGILVITVAAALYAAIGYLINKD